MDKIIIYGDCSVTYPDQHSDVMSGIIHCKKSLHRGTDNIEDWCGRRVVDAAEHRGRQQPTGSTLVLIVLGT